MGRGLCVGAAVEIGEVVRGGRHESWQARSQRAVSRLHGVDFDEVGHRLMVEVNRF